MLDPLLLDSRRQCEPRTKWLPKELQADTTPLLQAPVNMINLTWAEKRKGKAMWEVKAKRRPVNRPTKGVMKFPEKPKATIVKGVVLCSRCHYECELEVLTAEAILDHELVKRKEKEEQERRMNIMQTNEKKTSRNVFQKLEGDSQPKNLSEVFRNYEASEEVEEKEAKVLRWKEVIPPQPSYVGEDVRMKPCPTWTEMVYSWKGWEACQRNGSIHDQEGSKATQSPYELVESPRHFRNFGKYKV